jgi:hypothetical protein
MSDFSAQNPRFIRSTWVASRLYRGHQLAQGTPLMASFFKKDHMTSDIPSTWV